MFFFLQNVKVTKVIVLYVLILVFLYFYIFITFQNKSEVNLKSLEKLRDLDKGKVF